MSLTSYLVVAAIGAGAVAGIIVGFSWVFARLWCKPTRRSSTETPTDHKLPFAPVTFSSHGVPLHGWLIPADGTSSPGPTIVLTHGWSRDGGQMLPLARLLHEAGFAVLVYDSRGHGGSGDDGPITIRKFAEDLTAAVDYLQGHPAVDIRRLGVVAHSLGGSAAILAASNDTRIRALVSSSAFADPVTLTADVLRGWRLPNRPFVWLVCRFIERWLGVPMAEVTPRHRINRVAAPVLLIHGDADRYIRPYNLEALYTRADQARTERWLVAGRRHSDVMMDPDYGPRVIAFLRRHLSSA